MQPFDYRLAVQNPVAMALQGYMQGQQFQNQRVQAERDTQLYDMQMQQYQMQQQNLQQEQARAQQMQADLGEFADAMENGTATRDMLTRLEFKYGDIIGEHVRAAYEGKSQEYKDAQASKIARIGIAFTRSPEEGMRFLQIEKEAAQNAGDQQLLDSIEMMEGEAKISSAAPTASSLFVLGKLLPPEQFEAYKAIVLPPPVEREVVTTDEGVFAVDLGAQDVASGMQRLGAAPVGTPLVQFTDGMIRTGQLAPETGLVEDPTAPGGVRIVPLAGGSAESAKETAIATADDVIKTLNDLKTAPGARSRYGFASIGGFVPPIPGSEGANAQAIINKVKGAAFLQAFDSLKGAGQITQVEGEKATQAITVLQDQNISWDFALKAADELIAIVEAAQKRKAKTMPATENMPQSAIDLNVRPEVWARMTPEQRAAFED